MHRFIRAERANHSVTTLCRVLGVSRAGYYAAQRRPPCKRAREDKVIAAAIAEIHADSRETYGAPRVQAMLARRGIHIARKRVARLMRQEGLSGLVRRKRGKTTIRVPGIDLSMTQGGSPLDNAVAESFFATLKRELVDRYSWPTRGDLRVAIFEWIEVFSNRQRIHTTLNNASPEEFETLSLNQLKKAA